MFEGQPFAPQPQPIAAANLQSQPADPGANRLMTTNWNGYSGNSGGLNLCCIGPKSQTCVVNRNRFKALEGEDSDHDDSDHANDDAHDGIITTDGGNRDKGTVEGSVGQKSMPRKYTIGDAI